MALWKIGKFYEYIESNLLGKYIFKGSLFICIEGLFIKMNKVSREAQENHGHFLNHIQSRFMLFYA